jgi:penicillin-binding protein 1A
MYDQGYISKEQLEEAVKAPVTAKYHHRLIELYAPYVAEKVRYALVKEMGESVYTDGLSVYTSVDSKMQKEANQSLHRGLINYNKRHGYRGAIDNYAQRESAEWLTALSEISAINDLVPAVVIQVNKQSVDVVLKSGQKIQVSWAGLKWARKSISELYLGEKPKQASDILKVGDVIRVEKNEKLEWVLTQVPEVEGALVSLDPNDGAILAMTGGFDFASSHFNRVTQAWRQAGSAIKPFMYSAALANGLTLATMINDAPVVMADSGENALWRPQNSSKRFYGLTSLRTGLVKSRNLVSVRLLQEVGITQALNYIRRFGFYLGGQPHALSLALGSGTVTVLQLATGFSVFSNGGFKVSPHLIQRIDDVNGKIVYQADSLKNIASNQEFVDDGATENQKMASLKVPRVITEQNAYLINSALQGVVYHGTGRAAMKLKRHDLAGKTGTTNDQIDAWFVGYNADVVTAVWVGFDKPKSLHEYGAQAALPIWIDFMGAALKGKPESKMKTPPGIVTARINRSNGLLAQPNDKNTVYEIFRSENSPKLGAMDDSAHAESHGSFSESSEQGSAEELF